MKICKFDQERCFQPSASGVTEARWVTPGGTPGSPEQQEEEAIHSKGDFQPRLQCFTRTFRKTKEMIHSNKTTSGSLEQWKSRPNIQRGASNPNSNVLLKHSGRQRK